MADTPTKAIEVEIRGQRFSLRTDEDEAHLQAAAQVVDEALHEVTGGRGGQSYQAAVVAALSLASELVKLRRDHDELKDDIDSRTRALIQTIDERLTSSGRS